MLASSVAIGGVGVAAVDVLNAFSANIPVAEAAGDCKVGVRYHSYQFIDMFPINGTGEPGRLNPGDIEAGLADGFNIQLRRSENDPSPVEAPVRVFTDDKGNQSAIAEASLIKPCDANNGTAAYVWVNTTQNPSDRLGRPVADRTWANMKGGRELKNAPAIRRFILTMPDSDPRKKLVLVYLDSHTSTATPVPTQTPAPTETPIIPIKIEQPVRVQVDVPWYAWLGGASVLASLAVIAGGIWRMGNTGNRGVNRLDAIQGQVNNVADAVDHLPH